MKPVVLITLVLAGHVGAAWAQVVPTQGDSSPQQRVAKVRDPQAMQQQRRAAVRDALVGKPPAPQGAPAGSRKLSAQERQELRRQLRQQQHQPAP